MMMSRTEPFLSDLATAGERYFGVTSMSEDPFKYDDQCAA
jgi:hypothetical protein